MLISISFQVKMNDGKKSIDRNGSKQRRNRLHFPFLFLSLFSFNLFDFISIVNFANTHLSLAVCNYSTKHLWSGPEEE